jgi:DNA polymerase III delta prime subunit
MLDEFLWVEKYRPSSLDDCILPKHVKLFFKQFIKVGAMQNLVLSGQAGIGKTAVARSVLEDLGSEYIVINGSLDAGIDILRTKIKQFASTISLMGSGRKYIILDEADNMKPDIQMALRGFMEEFSANCGFIFTCNFKNKILQPIRESRCEMVDFTIPRDEIPKICATFMKRLIYILDAEGISYDPKAIAAFITKNFPDWRKTINSLQKYSVMYGKIDEGILGDMSSNIESTVSVLIEHMKDGDFTKMRKWVSVNFDIETPALFRKLWEFSHTHCSPKGSADLVLIIGQYQYWDAFVADREINTVACLTEIMGDVEWKKC